MSPVAFPRARFALRVALALFYFGAGALHLAAPEPFVKITPAFVPWPEAIVAFTGLCEIAGAIGLLTRRLRAAAAIGLALYAACVFPANVNHALAGIDVGGLPRSWWYHGPRLAFQPILVWLPLFAANLVTWPLRARREETNGRS